MHTICAAAVAKCIRQLNESEKLTQTRVAFEKGPDRLGPSVGKWTWLYQQRSTVPEHGGYPIVDPILYLRFKAERNCQHEL